MNRSISSGGPALSRQHKNKVIYSTYVNSRAYFDHVAGFFRAGINSS
jgi:hypothetical protein